MEQAHNIDIIITANSPGELSAYVRPVVTSISKIMPNARIILAVMPCQYASGREIEVAKTFKEISVILLPQEIMPWLFKNKPPKGIKFAQKGAVLFLGGDLLHAAILTKKLSYAGFVYSMNQFGWRSAFQKFFVPDERTAKKAKKRRIGSDKIVISGDLMVDGIKPKSGRSDFALDSGRPVVTFLPGSRLAHTNFLAPFFMETAQLVNSMMPDVQFTFALSPYTNFVRIEEAVKGKGLVRIENGRKYLISENGTKILLIEHAHYDAMNSSDLVVTIPGTNTAEAAALGKPMIAVIPFNKPEVLLFDGLAGIIGNAPIIGTLIKKAAMYAGHKLNKFIALPNRKAGRFIVPEIRGVLTPSEVAEKIAIMLKDPKKLQQTGKELKEIMGPAGAADIIAAELSLIS